MIWNICWFILFRTSPRPLHSWRSLLLRCFGAKLGKNCHFYPGSKIWAPWNLVCADQVTAADGTEIYNPAPIVIGTHATLSQGAYLCGATHNYDDPAFPLIAYASQIGALCLGVRPGVSGSRRQHRRRCSSRTRIGCNTNPRCLDGICRFSRSQNKGEKPLSGESLHRSPSPFRLGGGSA